MIKTTQEDIFSIQNNSQFEKIALQIFRQQAEHCKVYMDFVINLGINASEIKSLNKIPFLPIEFFKSHEVICASGKADEVFTSSGTTGMVQSRHLVINTDLYVQSFRKAFYIFYGDITKYAVLALLPSYLERDGSSLIYMVDDLIRASAHEQSGYFLYDHKKLNDTLLSLKKSKTPTILIGVTYALLDFAESHSVEFPELIVMETGGMKGKRREMVRKELHETLCAGFGVPVIHSEYGMTELLSQAYSKGAGIFHCPPWMNIQIRDTNDPLEVLETGQTGGINVIDLANINSCSFIATQDLGKTFSDGTFEVLGRFDNSDIRGCNLLVQ
ncbi:acyl transferase [Daejeonella sp.]|uniref:acyl transferase n=1 Tax=Daejeonella sp. TaxID=2805397 RepID=UPI0030C43D6C